MLLQQPPKQTPNPHEVISVCYIIRMTKTDLCDKNGKPIYVGDIVQHRLSLNSKHGGPKLYRIIQNKKGQVLLADPNTTDNYGHKLEKSILPYITVFDTRNRQI